MHPKPLILRVLPGRYLMLATVARKFFPKIRVASYHGPGVISRFKPLIWRYPGRLRERVFNLLPTPFANASPPALYPGGFDVSESGLSPLAAIGDNPTKKAARARF